MDRDAENRLADRLEPLLNALTAESPELTGEDLADVLWLAHRLPTPGPPASDTGDRLPDSGRSATERKQSKATAKAPVGSRQEGEPARTDGAGIYLPTDVAQTASRPGRPVRVPAPSALSRSRELARALRPLKRRAPSPFRLEIDVPGTVQRIAEERIRDIVFRPALDRWLSVSVVIDASASMAVWRSTARKFADLLDRMGAFRRLQVWQWRIEERGYGVSPATWVPGTATAARQAAEVVDTSGPQVILVVTDCVAPHWHDGTAANIIQKWTRRAHVALVSPLPESCWDRTALTEDGAIALAGRIAAAPNDRLMARRLSAQESPRADEYTLKVPVVSLRSFPLGQWAALVTGKSGVAAVGQEFPLRPAPQSIRPPEPALEGEDALQRFWAVASPAARKLARYLAAVPVIGLPVIRLVRQELLQGEAEQVHEAEVFLGGLLRVHAKPPGPPDPERTVYEFVPRVRELLLDSLPAVEAVEVHCRVSEYLERNWGQGVGFGGVVVDEGGASMPMTAEALGTVRVDVLRRAGVPVSSGTGVTVRPQLAPIRILLLAGLRFSKKDRSQSRLVRSALVERVWRLAKDGQKPDLIAVAGDVARNGKPEEYGEAAVWLDGELLYVLSPFDPANVFIVPGNHDLLDGIKVGVPNRRLTRFQSSLDQIWETSRDSLRGAHRPFCEFTRAYRKFDFEDIAQGSEVDVRGLRVGVVRLASAWSGIVRNSEESDTRFVGRRQLEGALQRVREADVRLVVLHHPIRQLMEPDRFDVLKLLEREKCRLVLHGPHSPPKPEATVHDAPWHGLEIGTGQLFASGNMPFFAVVEVEPGAGQVRVHPFGWAGESEGWVDASITAAGRWQFTLGNLFAKGNESTPAPVLPPSLPAPEVSMKEIRDAIVASYDEYELAESLRFLLDVNLSHVTRSATYPNKVFQLIDWADRQGRLVELVQALARERPNQPLIQQIYKRYGMAVPVDVQEAGGAKAVIDASDPGLAKIVRPHMAIRDFDRWREAMTQVEGQVCRIRLNGQAQGTGFLVGPDAVLTNYHVMEPVIRNQVPPSGVECQFDVKQLRDNSEAYTPVKLAKDWLIDHSPYAANERSGRPDQAPLPTADELDYALIRLAAPLGSLPWARSPDASGNAPARGWVRMLDHPPAVGERMAIIIAQHPDGAPMKLALDTDAINRDQGFWLNAPQTRLRYATNTEGGSSGAPCFDFSWHLIALHHYGDPKNTGTNLRPFGNWNQGVPIGLIRDRLTRLGKADALGRYGGIGNNDPEVGGTRRDEVFQGSLGSPDASLGAKVLIVGSLKHLKWRNESQAFVQSCRLLGKALADAGYVLVVEPYADTADFHVLEGAGQAQHQAKILIIRWSSADSADFERLPANVVVEIRPIRSSSRRDLRAHQLEAADAVIAIGGGEGTTEVIEAARESGKPLLTLARFAGSARAAWPAVRPHLSSSGIGKGAIDSLENGFDAAMIVSILRSLLRSTKTDPDGLYVVDHIRDIVLQSGELPEGDRVTGELLLLDNRAVRRQHTWLVATTSKVVIVLDDKQTRVQNNLIQWVMDKRRILPLTFDQDEHAGTVGFAERPKPSWYYSTELFPTTESLNKGISDLVRR
jgi:hypothetical protein